MAELIVAIADILGIYVIYSLGRLTIKIATLGRYTAAPYEPTSNDYETSTHSVSKAKTMGIGFVVLVLLVVTTAIYAIPHIQN